MSALICGSFAYDTIMVFEDQFKNHILPDQIHILNISFQVPNLRREYGGTAGNIAYNLKLLGGEGAPMGTVGKDFTAYADWLEICDIECCYIKSVEDTYTAQAYITTDMDDNQITAFHPGAMNLSHLNSVPVGDGFKLGMVSPDGKQGMIEHAAQFADAGIPFIFDPGQAIPLFDQSDFLTFIDQADWVAVNDYEGQLLQERSGLTAEQIAQRVKGYVVTRGAKGTLIYAESKLFEIPVAPTQHLLDPTGCGDAFRSGLVYGIQNLLDWETTGRIASLMGAIKIEHHGTQNHSFERTEFDARFKKAFGYTLD